MGKQEIKAAFADVVKVISGVVSNSLADNAVSYSKVDVNIQTNQNASRCTNRLVSNEQNLYVVNSSAFSSNKVYQSIVAQIIQELTDQQSTKASGGLFTEQGESFVATIRDMIQSNLTANQLTEIAESYSDVNVNVQHCIGTTGGKNVIVTTKKNITKMYNDIYSTNDVVQSVAADISNYISGKQDEKKTGILAILIRAIAFVIIGVVVLCIVIVGAYLITMKGG